MELRDHVAGDPLEHRELLGARLVDDELVYADLGVTPDDVLECADAAAAEETSR